MSVVTQREIVTDTDSYLTGLRASLRQAPDVILLGEMRDHETISTAMTAAETGHLILSTLHTIGAANTIDRVIDAFPARPAAADPHPALHGAGRGDLPAVDSHRGRRRAACV